MPVPYLSGYLAVTKPDGSCVEVFNSCRTKWNFDNRPESWTGKWEAADGSDGKSVWSGCCCWAWDTQDYEGNDPWFDPANPATSEVAGGMIDVPDGDGNGFYLEPSGSKRLVESARVLPLESYITFTVVAGSSRGERAYLKWLDEVFRDCCTVCDGLELTVFNECPCEDDYPIEVGSEDYVEADLIDPGAPMVPEYYCDPDSGVLEPYSGEDPIVLDSGVRHLLRADYRGIEPLEEGLSNCSGNRYKICFEIKDHQWYGDPRLLCTLGEDWSKCDCLCTKIFDACDVDVVEPDLCGPDPALAAAEVSTVFKRSGRDSFNNVGGLICLPGRYNRPEKVRLSVCLTPPQAVSVDNVLSAAVTNFGSEVVEDARLVVWEALEGVAAPDTVKGWDVYCDQDPLYSLNVTRLRPGEVINLLPDSSVLVECVNRETTNGLGTIDGSSSLLPSMSCDLRFWVGLEIPCGYGDGLRADIFVVSREDI